VLDRGKLLALVSVLLLLLAGCSGGAKKETTSSPKNTAGVQPRRGGILNMTASNDLVTLDDSQAVSTIDYEVTAGALYEGLYHVDHQGNLVAGLANGMPDISADGLTYTIHLKKGAMFAGPDFTPREVTAEDAAYGMLRALDPKTKPAPSWGGGYLYPIEGAQDFASGKSDGVAGIKVIDPYTLQVTLGQPTTSFIYGLTVATSWPVPKEGVEQRGEGFGSKPIGAGPFYVKEWKKGESITLARNPGYVDRNLPYLDEIQIDLGVDPNTQVLRLQNGQIDALFEPYALPQAGLRQLLADPSISPHVTPTVGPTIYYLALNEKGMFKNKDLRLAVAHAIKRDFVKQFGEQAKTWNQIFASTTKQSDPSGTRIYPYDPEKAKQYLRSGGYDGSPARVIYDVTDPFTSATATSLKQDLEAIGMKVQLKGLQQAQFFGDAGYNNPSVYDISPTYWRQDYPDGQDFISTNFVCAQVEPPGLNVSRYCSKDVDDLLAKSDQLAFGAERDGILRQAQQQIIDDAAGIPMMQVAFPVVVSGKVGQIVSIPTYAPFDWKLAWMRSATG
jgi:peptide/nickel transport system substrate-binding protein